MSFPVFDIGTEWSWPAHGWLAIAFAGAGLVILGVQVGVYYLIRNQLKQMQERMSSIGEQTDAAVVQIRTLQDRLNLIGEQTGALGRHIQFMQEQVLGHLDGIEQGSLHWLARKALEASLSAGRPDAREDVTVVIAVRNRYDHRILNCLKSIRAQNYDQQQIRIIVVDYGSDESFSPSFERCCREYDAQGIAVENKAVWNKSCALNIGLRKAETKYILIADVDIVFAGNYITEAVREMSRDPLQALFCRMRDCPENLITKETDVIKNYEQIKEDSAFRNYWNNYIYGRSILFTRKRFFEMINGYDEFYQVWGFEDDDLVKRLERMGVTLKDISGRTSHIHQWHLRHDEALADSRFEEQLLANEKHFRQTHSVIRNEPV
jgi:GT2 family glycosyltransferase